jgi:23S rRNA pseudouridine1911/1915/1917 synthase
LRAAHIVHLDDRFVVIDKPAGLSLATPQRAPENAARRLVAALPAAERELLAGREPKLVHRLDEPTSGLVLLALDEEMHRQFARSFAEHRAGKVYLAVVWGTPRPRVGSYADPLGPDRTDRRRMKVDPAGRPARSDYAVLSTARYISLVALWPATGRTHQLRVHLAAAGHPIVGDDLYTGARERAVREPELRALLTPGRALLHAWRLELPDLSPSRFEAPLPADFARVLAATGWTLASPLDLWQAPARSSEKADSPA